jgi:hypothetical protein
MKRRRWLQWAGSVALAAALTGCSDSSPSSDSPPNGPACAPDKTFSLGADTYVDVGKPGDAKGNSQPFVVVFDEKHNSRAGQVEMAIMLNRLYHNAKLRHLALEGSVLEKPAPNLTWFTSLPDPSVRKAVALQLLRQGEVSAAEFAAMVLPGFELHPIEYQVDLSDAASRSYTTYLVAIALTTMTPDQNAQANALIDQKKSEEAIRFIIGTNPWTKQRYELLKRETPIVTTNEMLKLGDELEAKAQEVGADVAEYREDLQAAQTFYKTAIQRSNTMAANTADLASAGDCAPIAMDIGAAHTTEVTDFLNERNMSYATVSPFSLSSDSDNGSLSTEAYDRKLKNQSVDPAGSLGALLDGRRKPRPSTEEKWFKAKAQVMNATAVIVQAAGGGGQPPFVTKDQLGLGGPEQPYIDIDLSTIETVATKDKKRLDVIFKVRLLEQNREVWIRAGVVADGPVLPNNPDEETLEKALKETLNEVKKESPTDKPAQVATLTPNIKAAITQTKDDALKAEI